MYLENRGAEITCSYSVFIIYSCICSESPHFLPVLRPPPPRPSPPPPGEMREERRVRGKRGELGRGTED